MYDLTGGLRIGKRHRRLDAEAALAHCPTLPAERLSSGFVYYDAQRRRRPPHARVARTAAEPRRRGGQPVPVVELTKDADGAVVGAVVDTIDRRRVRPCAPAWWSRPPGCGPTRCRRSTRASTPTLRPAKGVHLTVPWRLVRNDIAVIISVPKDKRSLFLSRGAKPDGTFEHCYVGTTDTDYDGARRSAVHRRDDIDYVLRALNHSITTDRRPITATT
jgi:glycerol-3-phosphate dehydrogenase